jgi:hypothetical protein
MTVLTRLLHNDRFTALLYGWRAGACGVRRASECEREREIDRPTQREREREREREKKGGEEEG